MWVTLVGGGAQSVSRYLVPISGSASYSVGTAGGAATGCNGMVIIEYWQ